MGRQELTPPRCADRSAERSLQAPAGARRLPYDELPMSKWNGNPYNLDGGGDGRREDDGAYFLLPYWMGRHHRLLDE